MIRWLQRAWGHMFLLPTVSQLEAVLSRILLAYVVYRFLPIFIPPAVQPVPVGIAHWVDLTWLAQPQLFQAFRQLFVAVLLIYVSGVGLPVVVPVLTLMHVSLYTLINSQGFTNHSHHILSVVLLAQAVVVLGLARDSWLQPKALMNAWLLASSQAAIASTYLIAACSKLIASDGQWLWKSHYIALDLVKTMRQNYYSQLEPRYATEPEGVVWMLEHPKLTALAFDSGFFIEAFIIFSVGTRMLSLAFGIAAILMHRGILYLMGLEFYQNEAMLSIFFVNVPFLLTLLWAGVMRGGRPLEGPRAANLTNG